MPSFDRLASAKVSKIPLSIICSSVLQLFPWELMLDESVVRYLCFADMIEHLKKVIELFFLKKLFSNDDFDSKKLAH